MGLGKAEESQPPSLGVIAAGAESAVDAAKLRALLIAEEIAAGHHPSDTMQMGALCICKRAPRQWCSGVHQRRVPPSGQPLEVTTYLNFPSGLIRRELELSDGPEELG